ncbi:hypothetical protein TIFTF001_055365, partial [Ficus carica]
MAMNLISPPWSGNLWSSVSAGANFILGPARALPILVSAWSWDLNRGPGTDGGGGQQGQMSGGPVQVAFWSSVSAGADFILGPARALPILVGAWSWDLTP